MRPKFIFIGLGNPGTNYENTRHNVGFVAADETREAFFQEDWQEKQKFKCTLAEGEIDGAPSFIVKPTTFMNRSGEAIKKIVDFYDLDPRLHILVCCDDVDLPLGTFRLKLNGGPGTHNGLKSIVDIFGEEFPRLRIGIGPQPEEQDLSAWVLSRFSQQEKEELTTVLDEVPSLVRSHLQTLK